MTTEKTPSARIELQSIITQINDMINNGVVVEVDIQKLKERKAAIEQSLKEKA